MLKALVYPALNADFSDTNSKFASRYALCSDDTTASHLFDGHNHLIDDLRDICFKHKGLLNFVKKSLRLMECSYMFTRTLESTSKIRKVRVPPYHSQ